MRQINLIKPSSLNTFVFSCFFLLGGSAASLRAEISSAEQKAGETVTESTISGESLPSSSSSGEEELSPEQKKMFARLVEGIMAKKKLEKMMEEGMATKVSSQNYTSYLTVKTVLGTLASPFSAALTYHLLKEYEASLNSYFTEKIARIGLSTLVGAGVYLGIDQLFSSWGQFLAKTIEKNDKELYGVNEALAKVNSTLNKIKRVSGVNDEALNKLVEGLSPEDFS